MRGDFVNRIDWLAISIALTTWAAHFVLVWSAASVFPHQPAARWIVLPLTLAALGVLWLTWRSRRVTGFRSTEGLALAIAAVATLYSALPAAIG